MLTRRRFRRPWPPTWAHQSGLCEQGKAGRSRSRSTMTTISSGSWTRSASNSEMSFFVRPMRAEDIPGAVSLQRACFPAPFPEELLWTADHLHEHLRVFPAGQFVAVDGEQVIASASNLVVSEENWQAHSNWEETVGGPYLRKNDSRGSTL